MSLSNGNGPETWPPHQGQVVVRASVLDPASVRTQVRDIRREAADGVRLESADVVVAGGGGGFGDPKQRDRKKLAREVRNGVTSEAAAREIYGAIDADLEVVE